MFRLDNRVALVTGAASGIGAATAHALAAQGATVVGTVFESDSHDPGVVAARAKEIGGEIHFLPCDVTSTRDVDAVVDAMAKSHGGVDIVVACAGVTRDRDSSEMTDEEFAGMLDVDLVGTFRCFRAALPHMRKKKWGRLLATSSVAGPVRGWSRHAHYAAAKAGVAGMTRSLALEFGCEGVTVNAIAPGIIVSPQTLDPVNSLGEDGLRALASRVPVGRNGQPEDVAALFCFLASDEGGFVTGQTFVVDGGITIARA